ncbi:MAG: hypothetical protein ACD_21C00263G0005 [uncultured bacterium]|nr:MAG: hypothetical protein ACD_21C00263G0005 [uncultured bacterium]
MTMKNRHIVAVNLDQNQHRELKNDEMVLVSGMRNSAASISGSLNKLDSLDPSQHKELKCDGTSLVGGVVGCPSVQLSVTATGSPRNPDPDTDNDPD